MSFTLCRANMAAMKLSQTYSVSFLPHRRPKRSDEEGVNICPSTRHYMMIIRLMMMIVVMMMMIMVMVMMMIMVMMTMMTMRSRREDDVNLSIRRRMAPRAARNMKGR